VKISLYVVDPDPAEQRRIATALAPEVEAVLSFGSAEALLQSLPLRAPALLIAATSLPRMSVPQLIRQLRSVGAELPVVAIGADADLPAAVEVMRAGAADFIARPFTVRRLRNMVRALSGRGGAEARVRKNQRCD
jgi:FixJ family two-component response regulator